MSMASEECEKEKDDVSTYSTEQHEEDDTIGQLMSSIGTSMSKSPLGGDFGGLSLAQKPSNAMLL